MFLASANVSHIKPDLRLRSQRFSPVSRRSRR